VIVQSHPQDFCRNLVFTWKAEFLTLQHANGSGCLTSYSLIIAENTPDRLNIGKRKEYSLKLRKNPNKTQTWTEQVQNKKTKIQILTFTPSLLQEIKNYIEETAKHF
jgi:hypothetical protein